MSIVVPYVGEMKMLEAVVNKTAPQDLTLKLFKNNITPAETDTDLTYTEATFSGYAAKALAGASWGSAVSGSGGNPSSITYGSQQTFAANAGGQTDDIYGYYVVQAVSGVLMWAERDPSAPFQVRNNGDQVLITPKLEGD
jgi:hypothetical protein